MSTLEGHFVSSPREREKRDRRESRGDEREGQGRKRNRNESEETEEIKTFPSTLTHYKDSRPCPTVSQYQLDAPVMKDTQHLCTTRPPPPCRKKVKRQRTTILLAMLVDLPSLMIPAKVQPKAILGSEGEDF